MTLTPQAITELIHSGLPQASDSAGSPEMVAHGAGTYALPPQPPQAGNLNLER